MIRHPLWLAVELVTALGLTLLGHLGIQHPRPAPPELRFALSVLGERELPDGSWQGIDLLRDPDAPVDRFQLTVRPTAEATLTVDAISPEGQATRLFPAPEGDGRLLPGRSYALPAPQSFYALEGQVRVRVTVHPVGAPGEDAPVSALPGSVARPYPLSDGSRAEVVERAFPAARGGRVELSLHQG